jgi:sugar lactone lactonase YvrE
MFRTGGLLTSDRYIGILYRYDQDGRVHQVLSGVGVPNGLSWSLDDRIMYFTDSMKNTIFAYDFDGESGEIDVSSQSVFFKPGDGLPDGHAQDVDGNLWVALWTGSKVVCVSPKGEVLVEISVPTPRPTVSSLRPFEARTLTFVPTGCCVCWGGFVYHKCRSPREERQCG